MPEKGELEVIYEDSDLLALNKPAGLVVHPGAGRPSGTLAHRILAAFPETAEVGGPGRPGIVHRLDKDTSGLMMVARNLAAHTRLVAALQARRQLVEFSEAAGDARNVTVGLVQRIDAIDGLGQYVLERLESLATATSLLRDIEDQSLSSVENLGRGAAVTEERAAANLVARVDQGAQHVFLPDHLGEFPWPPLARQDLVTHD